MTAGLMELHLDDVLSSLVESDCLCNVYHLMCISNCNQLSTLLACFNIKHFVISQMTLNGFWVRTGGVMVRASDS